MGESDVRQQGSRSGRADAPVPDLLVSKVRRPLLRSGTVRRLPLIDRLVDDPRLNLHQQTETAYRAGR
jgi:hypothetical protein